MKQLFFVLIFISFNLNGAELCGEFSHQGEKLIIKKSKSGLSASYKDFKSDFRCKKIKAAYNCQGDDDSGQFSFDSSKNILIIKNLSFGEPDGKTFQVLKKTLKGRSCS